MGEFLCILGQSGSGKSTLMNILGCLDIPTYGSYHLNGQPVSDMKPSVLSGIRNREIGFIFQGFNLIPALTALKMSSCRSSTAVCRGRSAAVWHRRR